MTLSVIIVNFQSQTFLKQCFQSLEKNLKNIPFEVILVNNDPCPFPKNLLEHFSFPNILIQSPVNRGFGAGCNLGAQKASGQYLLFLNPDSFLLNSSFSKVLAFLEKHPSVGAVGGKILLFPQKIPQPWTCGKQTTLLKILFRHTFNASWKKKHFCEVDWVSGTALLVKRQLFKKIGGFDESFFMYFEDQDFCLRLKKLGKKVFFLPFFLIGHYDGKSWKNFQEKKKSFYSSQKIFFQKHRPPIEVFFLKIVHFIFKGQ